MKHPWIWLVLGLVAGLPAAGDDECDCDHFPWKPDKCVETCGAKVLSSASIAEIGEFLGLGTEVALQIVALRDQQPSETFTSLAPLKKELGEKTFGEVKVALGGLKALEAEYLMAEPWERVEFWETTAAAGSEGYAEAAAEDWDEEMPADDAMGDDGVMEDGSIDGGMDDAMEDDG